LLEPCADVGVQARSCQVDEVSTNIGSSSAMMTTSKSIYRGYRFPAEVIQQAVWLYFRSPLSLRMVEDLLAARGIIVSHETVRCWAEKFGRIYASCQWRRKFWTPSFKAARACSQWRSSCAS